jgi:hypothetical protein
MFQDLRARISAVANVLAGLSNAWTTAFVDIPRAGLFKHWTVTIGPVVRILYWVSPGANSTSFFEDTYKMIGRGRLFSNGCRSLGMRKRRHKGLNVGRGGRWSRMLVFDWKS